MCRFRLFPRFLVHIQNISFENRTKLQTYRRPRYPVSTCFSKICRDVYIICGMLLQFEELFLVAKYTENKLTYISKEFKRLIVTISLAVIEWESVWVSLLIFGN